MKLDLKHKQTNKQTLSVVTKIIQVNYISHRAPAGSVVSPASCQYRRREGQSHRSSSISGADDRDPEPSSAPWRGFNSMCPPDGMFKAWSSTSAVESARRIDFHLSMRYAEWPHRRVVTQKNTRWRSSSTEWDSSPTRRWAGRSHKRRPVCYVSSSGIGFQAFSLRSAALICNRALTVSVGHSCSVNVGLIDCAQRGGAYPHTDAEGADVVPKEAGAAAHWGGGRGCQGTITRGHWHVCQLCQSHAYERGHVSYSIWGILYWKTYIQIVFWAKIFPGAVFISVLSRAFEFLGDFSFNH